MTAANSNIARAIFQHIAGGQSPAPADLAYYTDQLDGGWAPDWVAELVEGSTFVQNVVNPIIREYQAAFGRVPDQAGLSFWIGQIAPNGPTGALNPAVLANLNAIFAGSAEFTARYGATLSPTTVVTSANGSALVNAMYDNVLLRHADQAGLDFWLGAHNTVSQLLQAFAQSPEFASTASAAVIAFQNAEALGTTPVSGSLFSPDMPMTYDPMMYDYTVEQVGVHGAGVASPALA